MTVDPGLAFRTVAPFLTEVVASRLLSAAFEAGVIDRLVAAPLTAEQLEALGLAPRGADLMRLGLRASGAAEDKDGRLFLTPAFRAALAYRDLIETKLAFADLVLADLGELALPLLGTGGEFMARSQTFQLFRYDRAKNRSPENHAATARWVALTTALTRYEASGLLQLLDFAGVERLLDVGGNSGELARALAGAHPHLEATVFDLPVVCDIGRAHLAKTTEAGRVSFVEGDLRADPLPDGADLITFKSVLHDWPDDHASSFLAKAMRALKPGGRIVVFERAPFDFSGGLPAYHDLPNLMFMHFLRAPETYRGMLERLGLKIEQQSEITLDMPFFLLVARKS
jgi:SAM-dependent methyltransferase